MKTNETTPIPQGYKATPLGIIPQEWEVKRLEDMAQCFSGGTPKAGNNEYYDGNIPFIRSGEIHQKDTELFLSKLGMVESSAKMVQKGDLLMALYGANSGDVSISQIDGAINQAILCIRPRDVLVSFLCPFLDLNKDMYIAKYLQGGQGNLSGEIVLNYKIPVPLLAEQRKIAEVLGLWDKAIEKQSQLIEQLTLRKRGLMQQLLTAKRRLPGFSGPWKEVKLGEICNITTGKLDANAMEDNGIYPFFTCAKDVYKINKYAFDTEALLISGNGEYVGYVHYCKGKFNAYQRTYVLDKFQDNIFYLKYTLQYYLPKRILQTKSSSNTPYIVIGTFQDMIILEPSKAEQTAIAEVLTAADREIELAQQRLELLRQQKRGLMQQLLTGKKRVKY